MNEEVLEFEVLVKAEAVFKEIDTNSNGVIELIELRAHIVNNGLDVEQADELFSQLDANQDNEVLYVLG